MGIFKRPAKAKKGQKQYWYMRCQHKGKEYWESTGKRVGETTKDDAYQMFLIWKEEIKTGIKRTAQTTSNSPAGYTLYEFSKKYLQQKNDEGLQDIKRAIQALNNIMEVLGSDIPITEIDTKAVSKLISARTQQVSLSTIGRELKIFRNLFYYAIAWNEYPFDNPVKIPKNLDDDSQERRYIKPHEWDLIWNASPEFFKDILLGALHFGARRHEIAKAHISQVDLKNNFIEFPKSKGCNPRKIFLNETMKVLMPKLVKESYNGYLFKNARGKNYKSLTAITHMFKKIARSAGIEDLSFHCIRHTTATWMFQGTIDKNGNKIMANLPEVKYIMGHKNANTTMIYAHPEDSVQQAANIIDTKSKASK